MQRPREGLERHRREPADEQLRDGLIQRFEFTYELSHRMLRRYLRMIAPSPDAYDQMPFQDLIRSGNEQGLLRGDWPAWRRYPRHAGTDQPHVFGGRRPQQVAAGIPEFLRKPRISADQLQQRLR